MFYLSSFVWGTSLKIINIKLKKMAKILLKLDNPSAIITSNKDIQYEFYYAVLVDKIADLDDEDTRMIIYTTKEDFENGKGCASFPTISMFENWFEYDAHFIN